MKPKYIAWFSVLFLLLTSCAEKEKNSNSHSRPNFVFILVDDLGYKDLGCYGSDFYETPNIDRLALQGMRFTASYTASAVCSPTRASILTGKYPARLGITDWTGPEEWHPHGNLKTPEIIEALPRDELTIAEVLENHGYTNLYIGKWHLGDEDNYPEYHGFSRSVGATNAGAPPSYFFPYFRANWEGTGWPVDIKDLNKKGEKDEYLTDRLTDEALNFLDTIGTRPFFLYLSHYAVHKPLEGKPQLIEKYMKKTDSDQTSFEESFIEEKNQAYTRIIQNHPTYAAMIESMDESTGRIMKKIRELGLSEKTIIIFTSDNGGFSSYNFPLPGEKFSPNSIPTSNLPLRAGKGWYYEGGVRVPTIIVWPGVTSPGMISESMISSTDFYPTILDMAGIPLKPAQHLDGISFTGLINGESTPPLRDEIFWHYPHYHASGQEPVSAIRNGNYKLIHWIEEDYIELYDLKNDPEEKLDLSKENPEISEELMNLLDHWRKETGAQMPVRKN